MLLHASKMSMERMAISVQAAPAIDVCHPAATEATRCYTDGNLTPTG